MLQGIFPVIPTLFTAGNELDLDAQRRVLRFALDAGAHGLVFPGVASEYSHLSLAERTRLLALVAAEAGGKVPLVGGASAPTVAEVIAAGSVALEHGIRHLMIMAPVGLGSDVAAHRAFFRQIADGLPGTEIILQNAPAPTGAGLGPAAIVDIATAVPAIAYIKEETLPSGPAITALRAAAIPTVRGVFGGGGARYIIDEFERGEPPKNIAKRLQKEGLIERFNQKSGIFTLTRMSNDDCMYLDRKTRLCTIYDQRPDTCRNHPRVGPRPGYCAYKPKA